MANIAKTYTFVNGQPADATQVNKNFDDIITGVGDISAAGHALIDDANAAAQLATLGTAAYSEGTWTPTLNSFTVVGAAPAVSGTYKRIGNLVFITCTIEAGSGGNTSVACSGGTITGLHDAASVMSSCFAIDGSWASLGIGLVFNVTIYSPGMSAKTGPFVISATYNA